VGSICAGIGFIRTPGSIGERARSHSEQGWILHFAASPSCHQVPLTFPGFLNPCAAYRFRLKGHQPSAPLENHEAPMKQTIPEIGEPIHRCSASKDRILSLAKEES
jgi:hypothetical protein